MRLFYTNALNFNIEHKLVDCSMCFTGILFSNGDNWKEMRRFTLTNLRDYGMGKKTAEDKILEECHYLIEVLEKHKGSHYLLNISCPFYLTM